MGLKANVVGPKQLYFNPAFSSKLTTANFAAIATNAGDMDTVSPYAYTATVSNDYDNINYIITDAGAQIVAGNRIALGLFLSPQNDLGNFLFQIYGKAYITAKYTVALSENNVPVKGSFFFGRKATNNTVTSSLASVNNTLALYQLLKSDFFLQGNVAGNGLICEYTMIDSVNDELFTLNLSGGFVYCFGYMIENYETVAPTLQGSVSLGIRKYNAELDYYSPVR